MGRMKNLETLAQLRLDVPDTTIIDRVDRLFIPGVTPSPQRVSELNNYTQLAWRQEGLRQFEYEELCLTLGTDALTIAIRHRHSDEAIPSIGPEFPFTTAALCIDADSHRLIVTHQTVLDHHHRNKDAAAEFLPRLDHTLGVLSLGQNATRTAGRLRVI